MPFYIATIWTLSSSAGAAFGAAATERRVVREWAETEENFRSAQTNLRRHLPDDKVWFGPVGLSMDQRTPA